MDKKENMKQLMIRLSKEQLEKLEECRAKIRPIPSMTEMIRRAVEYYIKNN